MRKEALRRGDWIQTHTLRQFWPLDPRPEDVCLEDVAHALSLQCRFTGHVNEFYSVAEHSVRVSVLAEEYASGMGDVHARAVARWGLMHDAAEAYLVDLALPVKRQPEMAPYREAEARIMACVAEHFGLSSVEPPEVKRADTVLLYTEARDLFDGRHPGWEVRAEPLQERIVPWPPSVAKERFLSRFSALFPRVLP